MESLFIQLSDDVYISISKKNDWFCGPGLKFWNVYIFTKVYAFCPVTKQFKLLFFYVCFSWLFYVKPYRGYNRIKPVLDFLQKIIIIIVELLKTSLKK